MNAVEQCAAVLVEAAGEGSGHAAAVQRPWSTAADRAFVGTAGQALPPSSAGRSPFVVLKKLSGSFERDLDDQRSRIGVA